VIDHSFAYEEAMKGRHGQQLALTEIDAFGKDDPLFDPFVELELDDDDLGYDEETDFEEDDGMEEKKDDEVVEAEFREMSADGVEVELGEEDDDDEEEDEAGDEDEVDDEVDMYRNDGSLRYKKSQIAKFAAGAPAGGLFGVLELAGTQHKVTIDDVIVTEKLRPVSHYSIGTVHTFTDVLLVGSTHQTLVGMPRVEGAEIDVMVEEITQDAKVVIFKKRRKKHSQRKNGFRRDVTLLRVLDIRMPEGYNELVHEPRVEPEKYE
jgi:large subunit ribosomal protein L21